MSQHISDAISQSTPTLAQRTANLTAQAALNAAITNVPEPADVEAAHSAASELLALLAADSSEAGQNEHAKLIAVIKGMQTVDEIDAIMMRAQELVPPDLVGPTTALELVHDTALRENLARMLGAVWTYVEWQSLTRRLRRRLVEFGAGEG